MFKPETRKKIFVSENICMWHLKYEKINGRNSHIPILSEEEFLNFWIFFKRTIQNIQINPVTSEIFQMGIQIGMIELKKWE